MVKLQIFFLKHGLIRALRPLQQPACTGKNTTSCCGQGHRDHKAQGRARFTAVQMRKLCTVFTGQASDLHPGISSLDVGAQLLQAVQSGQNVLRIGEVGDMAFPLGQGRCHQQPVSLRLGGGRSDGAVKLGRGYGDVHGDLPSGVSIMPAEKVGV